jgi:hypothetical protein
MLLVINQKPQGKAHNGGEGMGQIRPSHIKRVKEIHGTNIDWPTKSNNSFSMFFEPPSIWPTFGGAN